MRCPECKNKVLQKSGDRVKLRAHGPVEFLDNGTCHTRCHWCRKPVELQLSITGQNQIPSERFVLKGERR